MEETSHPEERPDIKTRWKKGQSGNPNGRRLRGAGATLTGLARTMMERPVDGADGERHTRLTEYMIDVVRRADAGDLKSRMFLLQAIDRGDRRKLTAQRNARKAKSEELRKFEEEKAAEISDPMPPLSPEVEDEQTVTVSPTVPQRPTIFAPPKKTSPQGEQRDASPASAMLRRDPRTGKLLSPEGRELSREEEEQLLYPNWPHISPHLGKVPLAGAPPADSAGRESPAPEGQALDFARDFGRENFSQENPSSGRGAEAVTTVRPTGPSCEQSAVPAKKMPAIDTASLRRDPRTGNLVTPEGRVLSPEEEDRLANSSWPHISSRLEKEECARVYEGLNARDLAGFKSPAPTIQVIDFTQDSESEKFSQNEPAIHRRTGGPR